MKFSSTEQTGVTYVSHFIHSSFGWIFREQPVSDMGIDAQIEIVNDNNASGQLIALQIKTGESYFKEASDGSYYYYIDQDHYDYWMYHSLPVIVIIHNDKDKTTLWQSIDSGNLSKTEKHWKLLIPEKNKLTDDSKFEFEKIAPSQEYVKKRMLLALHYPIIKAISNGKKVVLDTNKFVHKSMNRGNIKIYIDVGSDDEELLEWPFYAVGEIQDTLKHFFSWYNYQIDTMFYNENYCEGSVREIYNILPDIYPWRIQCGEFAEYRLELKLNDLGRL